MARTPVTIVPVETKEGRSPVFVVLCDDSSLWLYDGSSSEWEAIPALPGSEAEEGGDAEEGEALPDAGGPRVDRDTVELDGETVTFETRGPLAKNSIEDPRAVRVHVFDRMDGWYELEVRSVGYDRASGRVTVALRDAPGGQLVRLLVRGTGETPVLGTDMIPLAGAVGGPSGSRHDGSDFVHMFGVGT